MKRQEGLSQGKESIENLTFTAPAIESLLAPAMEEAPWPESLTENQEFIEQIKERQQIVENINEVISLLPAPDMSLSTALEAGLVTERQLTKFYESLTNLLKDKDYQRILLYIPFEYLPRDTWAIQDQELARLVDDFRYSYRTAWYNQLYTHDVRANFVDGDVLEVESRSEDLPRVVKVAHLIPILLQTGILKKEEVLDLLESSEDPILQESIHDALTVSADMGIVEQESIPPFHKTTDARTPEPLNITKQRLLWLAEEEKRKSLESKANQITDFILQDELSKEILDELLSSEEGCTSLTLAIRKAVEIKTKSSLNDGQQLYAQYKQHVIEFWENESEILHEEVRTLLYHLHELGIIEDEEFETFDLPRISLSGPSSENLRSTEDKKTIEDITLTIETDPELSQYLFPVALYFGSKLKGYGNGKSDLDMAVLIKPGTSKEDKDKIQTLLKEKLSHKNLQGGITEFWLNETDDGFEINNQRENPSAGEDYWVHILFGAIWDGNTEVIRRLHEKLLVPYFSDTKTLHQRPARRLYIEELERDTLQYRLMHKGYSRFFPPYGGIETPKGHLIDARSTFWDSGYRQTALKLFASRVFFPKISKNTG